MLTKTQKEAVVERLKADIMASQGVFLTNLIGISSNDGVAVRKSVRDAKGKVVVARNSLLQRAGEGTSLAEILKDLKGPHALAFAFENVPGVAKSLKEAGKEHDAVELKGGLFEGKILSAQEIKALADLPSREEMLGTLLATFIAPVSALARTLHTLKEKCEEQGVKTPGELKLK